VARPPDDVLEREQDGRAQPELLITNEQQRRPS
jgi:hypothetical protein